MNHDGENSDYSFPQFLTFFVRRWLRGDGVPGYLDDLVRTDWNRFDDIAKSLASFIPGLKDRGIDSPDIARCIRGIVTGLQGFVEEMRTELGLLIASSK